MLRLKKMMYLKGPRGSPAPLQRSNKIPLVVFGKAMFGGKNSVPMVGKQHGIVDMIWREIIKRENAGELVAIPID